MKKIFVGLLFLFLYLKINGVDMIPAFVGYILIFMGIAKGKECPSKKITGYIAAAGAFVTGGLWLADIFGGNIPLPIGLVFQLLITYRLVLWVEETVEDKGRAGMFRKSWYVLAAGVLATPLLSLMESRLSLIALLIGLGAAIYYIYVYYQIWREVERNSPSEDPVG